MLPHEYARSALQIGLQKEAELGVNPFKFGMIGSTDAHTSLATTREENYWGKFAGTEPMPDRWEHYVIKAFGGDDSLSTFAYEELASGLAAVWARENTREGIFDAHAEEGNLRDHRHPHHRAFLRRLGVWCRRGLPPRRRRDRLRQRRGDGRRPARSAARPLRRPSWSVR